MYKKTTNFLIFWFLYLWNVLMEQLHMWLCIKNNIDACFKMCFLAWDWMFLFVYVCVIVSRDSRNYYCTSMTSYVSGLSTEMTAKRKPQLAFWVSIQFWIGVADKHPVMSLGILTTSKYQPVIMEGKKTKHTHTHKIEQDYLHDQYSVNNFIHVYLYLSFGIRQLSDISLTLCDSTVLVRHINKLKLKQREQNRLKMTTFIHNERWFIQRRLVNKTATISLN